MLITDSQVHIWEVDRPDRPWPKPLRNQPQLPDGFSAEQMIAAMDEAGVDRAVIVPPTWVGENNATALEAAEKYPGRFAVMGRFDPLAPGRRQALETWLRQPHMLGIRMTFRVAPYSTWLDGDTLDAFWADCQDLGIPVMVLVSGILPKLRPVAERFPGLKLIVDHMGCDLSSAEGAFAQIDHLIGLAKFENVSVKTSSAPCFSAEPYPHRDIYPYLRRIYDAFGPRRMMWGADLTRLRGTYKDCLRHFREGLDFLTEDDKEWVLGKTLAAVLNWPES
ncbi:MAG TPA: amidohydrolase family protein [Dehalococcoidia bacterium]|nr:amidohydrolase family protein [Dehalococcoidia bacterium]